MIKSSSANCGSYPERAEWEAKEGSQLIGNVTVETVIVKVEYRKKGEIGEKGRDCTL